MIIDLPVAETIVIGNLGPIRFKRGYYAYVGSALGGFNSRLNRHRRKDKTPKWHVDYLLQQGHLENIIACDTSVRVECAIARALSGQFESIPHFGSSDCKCASHLFYSAGEHRMREAILIAIESLSLTGRIVE